MSCERYYICEYKQIQETFWEVDKKTLHILIRSDKIDDYGVTSAEETSSIIKEKKER